ncbi:hypothetical protein V6N13_142354 [Hibiscus sabdariffa]|uniref:Uncharacterized protein n=1 Tax=Hibiscus sabdariffa TaxID=183260 RepID=A0ABR2FDW8_9ROSI
MFFPFKIHYLTANRSLEVAGVAGGRPPDVGANVGQLHVLERPASPVGEEEQRLAKKLRNEEASDGVVHVGDDMEA